MTFALAGRCARTGMLGVVVASSSPAVAARCAWARAGVGAVSTQNITDPALAPRLLDLLADGRSAPEALDEVVATAAHIGYRQLLLVDAAGSTAVYSGEHTLGRHASARGNDCVAAGNLLASGEVPAEMVASFTSMVPEHLGDRLIAALLAGLRAGGEEGEVHSAGVVLVDKASWPVTDLRVDWHDHPVTELRRIWHVWKPQAEDYVTRALEPSAAPGYGVPGE